MNLVNLAKDYFSLSAELDQMKQHRAEVQSRYRISQYTQLKPGPDARQLFTLYTRRIDHTAQQLAAVDEAIAHCHKPEVREIMHRYYTQGETLEAIADTMYIGMTTANRLKAIGVNELAQYRPIKRKPAADAAGG